MLLAAPGRGVVAVDAESGAVRWAAPAATAPLLAQGEAMLALGKGRAGEAPGFAVLSLDDGEVLRTCAAPPGHVTGDTLVMVGSSSAPTKNTGGASSLGVCGVSLSDGSERWRHEVVDPVFRGPYPP